MARDDIGLVLEHVRKVLAGKDLGRLTDRELLKRFAQERDAEAFAALVQRHGPMVLNVCRRMLRNDHDVEDAFQATFLILVRKAGTHKWDESVGNWLYVVAYRLGLRIRKGAARRFLTGNVAMAPTADPLTDVSGRELCLVLDEELCRLPDQYRTPLVLCCLEGFSRDEAARQCGLSLDKLKRRLAKGRLLLRQRLARRGFALSTVLGAALCAERSTASVLPSGLVQRVVSGAVHLTSGNASAGAEFSVRSSIMAANLLRGMALPKLTTVLAVTLALCAVGVGVRVALLHAPSVGPADQREIDQEKPPAEVAAAETVDVEASPARDRFGDPLPPGAVARMGTIRFRHSSPIISVAYALEGKALVSTSGDGVIVWDAVTGKQLERLRDLADQYTFWMVPVVSPDQKTLALSNKDGGIELWDLTTLKILRSWEASVGSLAYSSDGKLLAGATEGGIRLWDPVTGKEVRKLTGQAVRYGPIAFSPNGKTIAYGNKADDFDQTVCLCATDTGKELARFQVQRDKKKLLYMFSSLAFSPDGKILAAVNRWFEDTHRDLVTTVLLWNVATREELSLPQGKAREGFQFAFSPDSRTMAIWARDGTIYLSDLVTKTNTRWLAAGRGRIGGASVFSPAGKVVSTDGVVPIGAMAFSRDGKTLATGGSDMTVHQGDVATGRELHVQDGHQDKVPVVAFSPDGTILASAAEDRTVRLWDARTGQELRRLVGTDLLSVGTKFMSRLWFSPDGRTLIANCKDSSIRFWDPASGRERLRIRQPNGRVASLMALSPDGKILAACEWNTLATGRTPTAGQWPAACLVLYESTTGKELRVLPCPAPYVIDLRFAEDGKNLLAASVTSVAKEVQVHVLDSTTGEELRHFDALSRNDSGPQIAFSPDGRLLAVQDENVVRFYDMASGKEIRHTKSYAGWLCALAFSADCRTLAGVSEHEGKLRSWEVATGEERRVLAGQRGGLALCFSPDGTLLASAGNDTTALVWDVAGRLAPQKGPLTVEQLTARWLDLAGEDAERAEEAIWALVAAPQQSLPLLRKHLQPAPAIDTKRLPQAIADLDSPVAAVRKQAVAEVRRLGEAAAPALRKALNANPSAQARRLLLVLLEEADPIAFTPTAKKPVVSSLHIMRALEILEHLGTQEARDLLMALAKGGPEAAQTQEARAALGRLAKRLPPSGHFSP